MRNLKKFLALVLAMMMAFSLMVTANAANPVRDYPDIDQADEAFEEAIDVLTGMKVYSGDNGNLKPASTITRAEVAALIYRLATGDVTDAQAGMFAIYGNFPDVPHDAWYAGYVGFCANAGYIKGRPNGNFDPSGNVTGYEALAMILRAIGYDKNGEFTGSTWQTEVSALSQQLGILTNVKTTQYGGTLYLAARRDVVADLLFQADAYVPMVVYTPAFGYQPYGMVNGSSGNLIGSTQTPNPTLGRRIFGLTYSSSNTEKNGDGKGLPVLLGNEQTGESKDKSVMGYKGEATKNVNGGNLGTPIPYTEYTWQDNYNVSAATVTNGVATGIAGEDTANAANNAELGKNVTYTLKSGVDLVGHKLKLWYDDGTGSASLSNKRVYAYFDKATLTDVVTVTNGVKADGTPEAVTNPTAVNATATYGAAPAVDGANLYDLADDAGFAVNANTTVAFNNSFGRFGSDFDTADAAAVGSGERVDAMTSVTSPVRMYKLISNSGDKSLDVVIALNIESSRITESNNVNRVPTISVPVFDTQATLGTENAASDWDGTAANMADIQTGAQIQTAYVDGNIASIASTPWTDKNLKRVPNADNGAVTGVIAQAALVGNSVKDLGDYEFGIHITGTSPRTVSKAEHEAINSKGQETAWFLMNEVTAPVQGTVVAYNVAKGTVTLDNGTVLERSDYYHTVVGWTDTQPKANSAPNTAIPQGWTQGATYWEEGYANVAYKFYLDHEGKYLGAERTFGSTFLYGTYLDYDQKTSTSSFNYFLTGVDMNGEVQTVQLKKFWDGQAADGTKEKASIAPATTWAATNLVDITGTDDLSVPFRDTFGHGGAAGTNSVNGIGVGVYMGYAITGETGDPIVGDPYTDRNEYLANMNRLGIHNGAYQGDNAFTAETAFDSGTLIDKTDITLGAKETDTGSNKFFTEATKFILVEGYGTDSVKATVYTGISELRGSASSVTLRTGVTVDDLDDRRMASIDENADVKDMIYYTQSPYTYAQSGQTAMKIDTIILPAAAVSWSGGSGLYYVGDPNYTLINSWGTGAWKYNLYKDGELEQIWLTNDPSNGTAPTNYGTPATADATYNLVNDVFLNLKDTGEKANDGQPIYTAGQYDASGTWHPGVYFNNTNGYDLMTNTGSGTNAVYNTSGRPQLGYMARVDYSAMTRDAQTATFGGADGQINVLDATDSVNNDNILERVAGAKVVNLNAKENCIRQPDSGYIWPGITDLATLNQAGSIDPVTGRSLKVSAVVDPTNNLIVTCIYVCYEQ